MCYYIGIEDLAANAMIEIVEKKSKEGIFENNSVVVTLKDLEDYGAEVVRYINKETTEKALLILSKASTDFMFRNYSDFFEEVDDESAIKLREGKTVEDLKEKFRTYKAWELINAYMAETTVKILYDKYTGEKIQKD
jgi:hypothetical protein